MALVLAPVGPFRWRAPPRRAAHAEAMVGVKRGSDGPGDKDIANDAGRRTRCGAERSEAAGRQREGRGDDGKVRR